MNVNEICRDYFCGFQEVFRHNDSKITALALLKILSYFTLIVPLSFAVVYLFGSLSSTDQKVTEKAKLIKPEIVSDGWGTISLKINGSIKSFKDVVILNESAEDWNWGSMHHRPGIRIQDIENLIFSKTPKPDVIILSQGRGHGGLRENSGPGVLEVDSKVADYIKNQGVQVYILKTAAAIDKYNEIRSQDKLIAALIHTTC